tara:strand:- start:2261 stop:3436 length:1176 start_codon:yes stop_codon:yes gene_type:complete
VFKKINLNIILRYNIKYKMSSNISNNIYYDLFQTNLENNDDPPILCQFNEVRNQDFLTNPEDYKMSIVRFMIETPTLPLFRPTIQYTPIDDVPSGIEPSNYTIYSITLRKSGTEDLSQQFIEWSPQNKHIQMPNPPVLNTNTLQDNSNGYYDCYNYAWFLNLINNAFIKASTELSISNSPTIFYDSASKFFVMAAPKDNYDTNNTSGYYEIFMNKSLFQLFSSFPNVNISISKKYGLNYQIITNSYYGFSTQSVEIDTGTTECLMVYSEYSTTYLWSPVSSIVFTSSSLPIVSTNLSNPILTREGSAIRFNGQPNTRRLITDLVAGDSYKPYLVYTPSAEYRYIDLYEGRAIRDIDIQVYYQDKQGQLNEFKLSSGSSCSIKILFTRKVQL